MMLVASGVKRCEIEQKEIELEQAEVAALANAPDVHPELPELYNRRVAEPEISLGDGSAESARTNEILRSSIRRSFLLQRENRGETRISIEGSVPEVLWVRSIHVGEPISSNDGARGRIWSLLHEQFSHRLGVSIGP